MMLPLPCDSQLRCCRRTAPRRPRVLRPATCTQAAYLALTQLLDYKHELVLLLVNTLLTDLKSDNFVVASTALVVTTKLIGPELVNAGERTPRSERASSRQRDCQERGCDRARN